MRIITLNCNGIRSAARRGLFAWLCKQRADVLCLQETKAQITDLTDAVFFPKGWHVYFNDVQRAGYAGVALYCRQKPDEVLNQLKAAEFDAEGRYLETRFGKLSVISLYLPSGSAGPERQASKDRFLNFFQPKLREWIKCGREFIVCGDWNIAHKEIDLKNWKANQKYSGFLPHERKWLDVAFGPEPKGLGWVDAYRVLHPEHTGEAYTWWSNRGAAWAKNVGWRIDYQFVTPALRSKVRKASIYKAERFSDHAPLIMDYDLAAMALLGPRLEIFTAAILIDNFATGFAGVALVSYMSSLTSAGYTATQYALLSSFYALLGKAVKGLSGVMVEALAAGSGLMNAYALFFAGSALVGVPAVFLVWLLTRRLPAPPPASASSAKT